jgi:hypothetical protein
MNRNVVRLLSILLAGSGLGSAHAINFEYEGAEVSWTTKLTAGAAWRVEGRDPGKIGKLNIPGQQNLCSDGQGGGDDCISLSGDPEPNQRLVDAKGGYFQALMDDGNMNFDKGDLVSAIVKLNTQLNVTWEDWVLKVNYVGFYDEAVYNLDVTHVNTQYQPRHERLNDDVRDRAGMRGEFREAFILRNFNIGDRSFSVSVGNQRVRWGEANLHLFNTLDVINPLDAVLPLQPGFNLNELAVPTGMVLVSGDIIENLSFEALYQYDWDTTRVQPSGTFFSSIDPAGIDTYMPVLSLGQFPEDPNGQYVPGEPFKLLSSSIRAATVVENGNPAKDSGQYGLRVNWYAEDLNDGTEFGLYYLNYHSRVPYFSILGSNESCLRRAAIPGNIVSALLACQFFNGTLNPLPHSPDREPLPVETTLVLDYPEDIKMFGVSFNTTAFGWSVSGEYSYRPNLPAQILISDVFYAGFQPAFATQDIPLNPLGIQVPDGPLGGTVQSLLDAIVGGVLPGVSVDTILPGAETFIPSVLAQYRGRTIANGNEYGPGDYVKGYERLKTGQFVINALKLFPSTLGADDVTLLAEFGATHIIDMPKKPDLYFQGTLEHTHPTPGADCSGFPEGTDCTSAQVTARINPTQQTKGFADDFACGVRFLVQFKYSNFLNSGINVNPTLLWFEDIYGTTIFPVQNYVEGNRWVIPGVQFEIGQAFNGTLLYQLYDGKDNQLQDRDSISVSLTYNF